MKTKLTERDIFDHVFNKNLLDKKVLELLENDPGYKELKEYFEFLKKELSAANKDNVSELAEKLRQKLNRNGQ